MNIEKELNNLAQEVQNIPDRLDMNSLRKRVKRRKTIHTVTVIGRSLLIVFCTLFLSLFIGVNSSVSFAKAATDLPVIGNLSSSLVIRPEIRTELRDALRYNNNREIGEVVEAGGFTDVSMVSQGKENKMTCTIQSYIADELSLGLLLDVKPTDIQLTGMNVSVAMIYIFDLDTGEPIDFPYTEPVHGNILSPIYTQIHWTKPCRNFGVDIILCDPDAPREEGDESYVDAPLNKNSYIDSYHFEFHNVQIAPSKEITLDRPIMFEGSEIATVHKVCLSPSTTDVVLHVPDLDGMILSGFDMYITDEKGRVISDPIMFKREQSCYVDPVLGDDYWVYNMPSIYYKDLSKIQLHIVSVELGKYDPNMLVVNLDKETATYNGKTIPILVYDSTYSYKDFGLLADPSNDRTGAGVIFLIPKEEGMPAFNSEFNIRSKTFVITGYTYPTTRLNGQEYIVIQAIEYRAYLEGTDRVYHFVSGENKENHRFYQMYEIDI